MALTEDGKAAALRALAERRAGALIYFYCGVAGIMVTFTCIDCGIEVTDVCRPSHLSAPPLCLECRTIREALEEEIFHKGPYSADKRVAGERDDMRDPIKDPRSGDVWSWANDASPGAIVDRITPLGAIWLNSPRDNLPLMMIPSVHRFKEWASGKQFIGKHHA